MDGGVRDTWDGLEADAHLSTEEYMARRALAKEPGVAAQHQVQLDIYRRARALAGEACTCLNEDKGREFTCSACGVRQHILAQAAAEDEWSWVHSPAFCPHCGAKVVER